MVLGSNPCDGRSSMNLVWQTMTSNPGYLLMLLWAQWPWQHNADVLGTGSIAMHCRPNHAVKYTLAIEESNLSTIQDDTSINQLK